MSWIDSNHRVIHDEEQLTTNCRVPEDPFKRATQTIDDMITVCAMLETGKWRVCWWCIGPAVTVEECVGLVNGTIKRQDLMKT